MAKREARRFASSRALATDFDGDIVMVSVTKRTQQIFDNPTQQAAKM